MTRYVRRFSRTERVLHWTNAIVFFVLLGSGLVLYLPSLAVLVGRRPLVKDVHFWSGVAWLPLLARRATSNASTATTHAGCSAGGPRRRAASTPARR
jgi:cytochrome b561